MTRYSYTHRPVAGLVLVLLIALVGIGGLATRAAHAQTYRFGVPQTRMQVFIDTNAQARIVYDMTFANDPNASPIDIVDIGMPNEDYDIRTITADLDGTPLTTIRPSEFVTPGVEIPLGSNAIAPGATGTLHVEFTMDNLVFEDTTNNQLASLQITPTWFGDEFVQGNGDLEIIIHLPPTVPAEQVFWQDIPYTGQALLDGRQVVAWDVPDWGADAPYRVGVSFAAEGMTGIIRLNAFQLLVKFVEDNPLVQGGLLVTLVGLAGAAFLRFSGCTGITVLVILVGALGYFGLNSAVFLLLALPVVAVLFGVNEWQLKRRERSYLPPISQMEGGGIKRGLTAAEAAIILELPLNRVLLLVIFGMLKKGIITQTSTEPLQVALADTYRSPDVTRRSQHRRQVAAKQGVILHDYEQAFLDVIEDEQANAPGTAASDLDFGTPMKQLIEHAAQRISGFDLSDTQDYYRSIIQRALTEASSIGDIEQREQVLDRNLEWLLMGDNDRYDDVFSAPPTTGRRRGYTYRPVWMRTPYIGTGQSWGGFGDGGGGAPAIGGSTNFGDVAASFAGWTENTLGGLAGSISPGSVNLDTSRGIVDLSGVDVATGDILAEMAKGGGSGGGGGGCACAGCACACACAGGGR